MGTAKEMGAGAAVTGEGTDSESSESDSLQSDGIQLNEARARVAPTDGDAKFQAAPRAAGPRVA